MIHQFRNRFASLVHTLTITDFRGHSDHSQNKEEIKPRYRIFSLLLIVSLSLPSVVLGQGTPGAIGVRAGIGADFAFEGVAYGGGASYAWTPAGQNSALEVGVDLFVHRSEETDSDMDYDGTRYDEKTSLTIFTLRANGLFNYDPAVAQPFFIAGAGFGVGSLMWEEYQKPADRPDLRLPYDDVEGTAGALLLNLGVGYTFGNRTEFRAETPMFIFMNPSGGASAFVPTLSLGVQYRFE